MWHENLKKSTGWRQRACCSAILVVAVALAFAGCGGGGGGGESQALTKEQFIAKANAICAEAKGHTAQFSENFPRDATPQQAQQFFRKVAPYSKQAADKIAALPAPAGDEQVKTLQDAYQQAASKIAAAGKSAAKAKAALKGKAGELGSCAFAPPNS